MLEAYQNYRFLDIGNTSVVLMKYDGQDFIEPRRFLTRYFEPKQLSFFLKSVTRIYISNVVTELTQPLKQFLDSINISHIFVTVADRKKIQLKAHSEELGADILLQLEGAYRFYPNHPFCVVGMGTAITVTVVKNQIFQGGLVAPDYKMQLDSLYFATSKLPKINYHLNKKVTTLYNTDTISAIKSGTYHLIYYGLKGIIQQLKEEIPHLVVIGTGGFSEFFQDLFDDCQKNLLFFGFLSLLEN